MTDQNRLETESIIEQNRQIAQLETRFAIQVDPADIFDYPLLDQLIEYVYGLTQEA